MNSPLWAKTDYIKSRTEYHMEENKGVKMSKKMARECAEEDWERYCEKYGYDNR